MTPVAMTIAGSDPSGGAGFQADLKTFHQHGGYGTSIVTLPPVPNRQTVAAVEIVPPDFVAARLDAVVNDPRRGHAADNSPLISRFVIVSLTARSRQTHSRCSSAPCIPVASSAW